MRKKPKISEMLEKMVGDFIAGEKLKVDAEFMFNTVVDKVDDDMFKNRRKSREFVMVAVCQAANKSEIWRDFKQNIANKKGDEK